MRWNSTQNSTTTITNPVTFSSRLFQRNMENGALRRENIHTLAELIGGKRKKESDTTFFKSVGMALFDIAAADYLCEKAAQKGLGQKVEF